MSVDDHGLEAIRKSTEEITPGDKSEYRIRTTATGTFTLSGLQNGGRVTTMTVGDTAIPLPATPLAARNAISIRNLSSTDKLYIGYSTAVTADRVVGVTSGDEIDPDAGFNVDITDEVILYGICESGKSVMIKVHELS